MSSRERVEQVFGEFCAWLRSIGVGDPYYHYPKEVWGLALFQADYNAFDQQRQAKAQAAQRRSVVAEALKDPSGESRGALVGTLLTWSREERQKLADLLLPSAPLEDGPPADVQADGDRAVVTAS